MRKTTKKIIILVALTGTVGLVFLYCSKYQRNSPAAATAQSIALVEKGPISISVSSTGTIESNLDVDIMSEASGEIITLPYDFSDYVEKETLLVELDPEDEERNVHQAEVSLTSTQAKLVQARQNLKTAEQELINSEASAKARLKSVTTQYEDAKLKADRMKTLFENKRVSQEEYETARTTAAVAEVELENARISLDEIDTQREALETKRQDVVLAECQVNTDKISLETARERLAETKVYAPMSGYISEQYVQIGQIVSSPLNNVGGGTTLLTLSDLSRIFVLASVDESDIGKILVGQKVNVTADAYPDEAFDGKVVRIATKGSSVSNVVTFDVKIEVFGEGKDKLKPGMTANVDVLISERESALLLPSEAVMGAGENRYVLLPGNEGQVSVNRPVNVGIDDGIHVEILKGLSEGDKVLLSSATEGSAWTQGGSGQNNSSSGPSMMFGGPPPH